MLETIDVKRIRQCGWRMPMYPVSARLALSAGQDEMRFMGTTHDMLWGSFNLDPSCVGSGYPCALNELAVNIPSWAGADAQVGLMYSCLIRQKHPEAPNTFVFDESSYDAVFKSPYRVQEASSAIRGIPVGGSAGAEPDRKFGKNNLDHSTIPVLHDDRASVYQRRVRR